jgi:hypothetical protein
MTRQLRQCNEDEDTHRAKDAQLVSGAQDVVQEEHVARAIHLREDSGREIVSTRDNTRS